MRTEPERASKAIPDWDESHVTDADEEVIISHNWDELRRFMAGTRGHRAHGQAFTRAAPHRIAENEIHEYYANFRVTNGLINADLDANGRTHRALRTIAQGNRGLHYAARIIKAERRGG